MAKVHFNEDLLLSIIGDLDEPTTTEIVRKSGLSKVTSLKYLNRLRRRRLIQYRKIGPSKVWSLKDSENKKKPDFRELKPKISHILHEFEELTGSKANLVFESRGLAITTRLTVK